MRKKEPITIRINYNREVIEEAELTEDGWISFKFKPPHPIPTLKKENRKEKRKRIIFKGSVY